MKTLSHRLTSLRARLAALCLAFVLGLAGVASATTYTVTTVTDHAFTTVNSANGQITGGAGIGSVSLRSAVIAANVSGVGPHTINVPAGTYNLSVNNPGTLASGTIALPDLEVGTNLSTVSIIGTGVTPSKIVQTVAGNDVITTGFKTTDGSPAIVNLTLNNLEITGGGFTGIFTGADDGVVGQRSSTTIINCNIHDNTNADASFGQGGAIFNQGGDLSISGSTFTVNSATNSSVGQGGAIYYNLPNVAGAGSVGTFSVTGCTFTGNTSAIGSTFPAGGAIVMIVSSPDASGGAIDISGNIFSSNQATGGGDGGAIAISNAPGRTVNILRNTFSGNTASNAAGHGGAIAVNAGTVNVTFNRFISNTVTTAANGSVLYHGNSDTVNANDNWWSRNTGPALNEIAGTAVTQANWLQLKLSALASTVAVSGSTTLTASFLSDSANNVISAANLGALIGQPITFGGGSFGATSLADATIQAAGTAGATFTAGTTAGVSAATAQVDNAPAATTNITIPPTVTLNAGTLAQSATSVVINGTGFSTTLPNNVVTLTGGTAGAVTAVNGAGTQLTVSVSGLIAGNLLAVVTTNGVGSGGAVQVATVTSLSITPSTANLAANAPQLIIAGTGFSTTVANNTVVLSSGTATVTAATATQLTCTLAGPPSVGALNATVTVVGNGSTGPTQVATIVGAPTVTANTANRAINAPTLVIVGTNFSTTASDNTVAFNLGAIGTVTTATATSLTVTFSTQPTSTGSLTANVTVFGGSTGATQVATIVPAPTVTLNTGNRAINAPTLVINGTNFDTAVANNVVAFNLGAVGTVTGATATSLTVTFSTPPSTTGSLTAIVTTDGGTSGVATQVATIVPAPTVTSNTANRAINAPTLVIAGTNFDTTAANNTVAFNLGAVGTVTTATATSLTVTFTTQPTSTGSLTAVVTTDGGTSGAAVQVATIVAAPTVTSNTANRAINAPTLVIAGTNFNTTAANNTVVFNNSAVGTVTTATATSLTVTFSTPPSTTGSLTAVVTTDGGDSGAAVQVATIVAAPTVTLNAANLAQNAPTLVIAGTNFNTTAANNTVAFNLGAIGTVTSATSTQLTVTFSTQPTSTGSLTAIVTTDGGTSGVAVQVATVVPVPTVTPNTANLPQNATQLIINGTNFSATAANNTVVLSSGTATVTAATTTQLTCTLTGPLALGSLTAIVTTPVGPSGAAVQVANVVAPPTFSMAFNPAQILVNGTSSLDFTIVNPAGNNVALTGVAFTLTLPAGVTVANASTAVGGGTLTTTAPTGIALTGASVGIGGTLQFSVTVTGAGAGTFTATTQPITSTNGGTGLSAVATLTTNRPPNATPVFAARSPGGSVKIPVAQILAAALDPDAGDIVTLVSVGNPTAPAHGTATYTGNGTTGFVFYTPTAGDANPDTFSYTVTDNHGAQATSVVNITIANSAGAVASQITKQTRAVNGTVSLSFAGVPGYTVGVQFTSDLMLPWVDLGPLTMNGVGQATFTDSAHLLPGFPNVFYRLIYPAP